MSQPFFAFLHFTCASSQHASQSAISVAPAALPSLPSLPHWCERAGVSAHVLLVAARSTSLFQLERDGRDDFLVPVDLALDELSGLDVEVLVAPVLHAPKALFYNNKARLSLRCCCLCNPLLAQGRAATGWAATG